jgi:hypothetical protein
VSDIFNNVDADQAIRVEAARLAVEFSRGTHVSMNTDGIVPCAAAIESFIKSGETSGDVE